MKDPIRQKFNEQRCAARRRRIGFELTYAEWLKIWIDSGHWHERGRHVGQYVMARKGDKGPYAVGNVDIVPVSVNSGYFKGMKHGGDVRAKISASGAQRWRTLTPRQRNRLSVAMSEGQLNRWAAGRAQ